MKKKKIVTGSRSALRASLDGRVKNDGSGLVPESTQPSWLQIWFQMDWAHPRADDLKLDKTPVWRGKIGLKPHPWQRRWIFCKGVAPAWQVHYTPAEATRQEYTGIQYWTGVFSLKKM